MRKPLSVLRTLSAGLLTTAALALFASGSVQAATNLVLACYPGAPETFIRDEIIPRFEKQFDAKITYLTGNSPGTIAKLQAQKDDPQIDLACIDDGPLVQAKGMDLVQPTDPAKLPNLADMQEVSVFKDHIGVGWGLFRLGIAFNPEIYKQKNIPTPESWSDLARPELKGHVVVNSISISYTPILLSILARANGGDEKNIDPGFAEMKKIRPNIFTFDTTADVTPFFQQEEAWAGVWTDSETYSYVQRTSFPLKFVFPKEGTTAIQTTISVVKNTKNADMAEKFINYFIGTEAQELMAQKLGWMPANKKAKLPSDMAAIIASPEGSGDNMMSIDHALIAQERPAWVERWNKEIESQ
ncbi:MAG: polyamine ABC transporter substrate-binding protein [Parvibaculaceae bacterium]